MLQIVAVGPTDLHLPLRQQLGDRGERECKSGQSPQGGRHEFVYLSGKYIVMFWRT